MTYEQAIERLNVAKKFAINPSLDNITAMCSASDNPQNSYECVQIAGTNGKSSTARYLASLLRLRDIKVGLYTSPELIFYEERIEINGQVISRDLFAQGIKKALNCSKELKIDATEFELLTFAALWIFAQEHCDVVVLECGLGGRWDATNIVNAKACVFTGIDFDHTSILGNTLEEIAAEKAAIIDKNSAIFTVNQPVLIDAINARCLEVSCIYTPVILNDEFIKESGVDCYSSVFDKFRLAAYQKNNFQLAYTAWLQFCYEGYGVQLNAELCFLARKHMGMYGNGKFEVNIPKIIHKMVLPGRFEILRKNPYLIIDAAHNPQSAKVLVEECKKFSKLNNRKIDTLILGILKDKDYMKIIAELVPIFSRIIPVNSSSSRAISAQNLEDILISYCKSQNLNIEILPACSIVKAIDYCRGFNAIATGSITVAGIVKKEYLNL
ncbi:MAG: hypothetical protein MJ189_03685 [Coriobacteriales bacterium]|nr:hypothetical protein [Coriobacteriales bacterium]